MVHRAGSGPQSRPGALCATIVGNRVEPPGNSQLRRGPVRLGQALGAKSDRSLQDLTQVTQEDYEGSSQVMNVTASDMIVLQLSMTAVTLTVHSFSSPPPEFSIILRVYVQLILA